MKRFLPLVFICWGVAWSANPFPHSLHLGMGLECVGCHKTAPVSTKAQDNLMPSKEVCLNCHEQADIAAPPVTKLTKFNHFLHLKIGNVAPILAAAIDHKTYFETPGSDTKTIRSHLNGRNACQACHRGLEESDRVSAANMPRMSDCLVCHTVIQAPFSCWDCHAKDAELRPASHTETPHFLDAHTTGKLKLDKTTCALCHGRTFVCMGCH